jgi:hypothetical protein
MTFARRKAGLELLGRLSLALAAALFGLPVLAQPGAPPPVTPPVTPLVTGQPTAGKPDEATYRADVARWQAGDIAVDLGDLRRRHAGLFGGYVSLIKNIAERDLVRKAMADKDWAALAKFAEAAIAADPLDMEAHFTAEAAYAQSGRTEDQARAHAVIVALLQTITGGRNGRSAQGAWQAMSVAEEYTTLRLLGMTAVGQALRHVDGHSYDVMSVKPRGSEQPIDIWFNIDWFFGRIVP